MTCRLTLRTLALTVCALALSQTGFADPVSGCVNVGSPINQGGTLYTSFTCELYPTSSTYSIDLTPVLTQGGANLADNAVGAGYLVLLNGNPLTVSNNDANEAALFNTSLWDAVLFFPGNVNSGFSSDTLTVDYSGAFPSAATVRTVDEALYGKNLDSGFFAQATGLTTVISGGPGIEYDVTLPPAAPTPEPGSFILLLSGMLGAGLFIMKRQNVSATSVSSL